MNKNGPIVILEEDVEDQEFLSETFQELKQPNEVIFFRHASLLYDYLLTTKIQPFIILSEISVPGMSGLELHEKIFHDPKLKAKGIPYIFMTTGNTQKIIEQAYGLAIQGFFRKPNSLTEWKDVIKKILDYWNVSLSPENF